MLKSRFCVCYYTGRDKLAKAPEHIIAADGGTPFIPISGVAI